MQLGLLGRTSVEPTAPGPSRRDRLIGAVAQWQLRLCFQGDERSEVPYCSRLFFFAKTLHPSAFVKFQHFFSKPTSPRQFKFLKTEPQLNTLPSHVRRFQMFLDWAILLASKTRLLQKFLGFFFDFA